jgi:hAT family C-terminal dimerisation region/Domain of unknown function (DUF4413)
LKKKVHSSKKLSIYLFVSNDRWLLKSFDVELRLMAEKMKTKSNKYWDDLTKINMLLFIAVILDAHYKL